MGEFYFIRNTRNGTEIGAVLSQVLVFSCVDSVILLSARAGFVGLLPPRSFDISALSNTDMQGLRMKFRIFILAGASTQGDVLSVR